MVNIENLTRNFGKSKLGKIVKKTAGIAGLVAMTSGIFGYTPKVFSQTENKSYQDTTFVYQDKSSYSPDKPIVHQYDMEHINQTKPGEKYKPDTLLVDLNNLRKGINGKKPMQLFIFRAETSFDSNLEISPIEERLNSYSPYAHIESFEVKYSWGADGTRFKTKIDNEKELIQWGAPPSIQIYVSDTSLLKDVLKNSDIPMRNNLEKSKSIESWNFDKNFITFYTVHGREDFYEKINKLISFINKRELNKLKK